MFLIKMVLSEFSDLYKKLSNVMETKDIEQACHILKRVAQDAEKDIDKYKSELENL